MTTTLYENKIPIEATITGCPRPRCRPQSRMTTTLYENKIPIEATITG